MKKVKDDVIVAERPVYHQGGTERSIAQLAEATHRLSMRRVRDVLPGKLETRRLVLRAPIRGDVPELVRLADNKAIAERLANFPSPYSRADAVGFVEIFSLRPDQRPYAMTLDGHFVGVVGFAYEEGQPPELGYWLGEPFWGKGLMTEAARALIDAAQRTHYYDLIGARVRTGNVASLRVLEKLGFHQLAEPKRKAKAADQPYVRLELQRPRWM